MKLQVVVDQLDNLSITMKDLLRTLARNCAEPRYRRYWNSFKRFAYIDMVQGDEDLPKLNSEEWDRLLQSGGYGRVQHVLRKELLALSRNRVCGKFQYPDVNTFGSLELFSSIQPVVEAKAPRLILLLNTIARSISTHANEPPPLNQRQIFWVQQLLFSIHRSKGAAFAKAIGIYLIDSGTKRRAIDMLSALGVCCSWSTAQDVMKNLTSKAEEQVRFVGSLPNTLVTYDNFDFSVGRSTEYLGNRKQFQSITTSIAVLGNRIPYRGLHQNMWRPSVPLRVSDVWSVNTKKNQTFEEVTGLVRFPIYLLLTAVSVG